MLHLINNHAKEELFAKAKAIYDLAETHDCADYYVRNMMIAIAEKTDHSEEAALLCDEAIKSGQYNYHTLKNFKKMKEPSEEDKKVNFLTTLKSKPKVSLSSQIRKFTGFKN